MKNKTLSISKSLRIIVISVLFFSYFSGSPLLLATNLGTCGIVVTGGLKSLHWDDPNTTGYILDSTGSSAGNIPDHQGVFLDGINNEAVWDMGVGVSEIWMVPFTDHGPTPQESNETLIYYGDSVNGPWTLADRIGEDTDGPSNWVGDNNMGKWQFNGTHQFVRALSSESDVTASNSFGLLLSDDTEVDAICATQTPPPPPPPPSADLSVVKSVNKNTANVGDTVIYTLVVKNDGPDTATNVVVSDILSPSLNFVSVSSTLGIYATSTNLWNVTNLSSGSYATTTITVTVKSGSEGQIISNSACISGEEDDSNNLNDTSNVNFNVNSGGNGGGGAGGGGNATITSANLKVTKTVDKSTVSVGDTLTYTIAVVNNGPNTASSTTAKDTLPSGVNFVSASTTFGSFSTTTGVWTIGNLTNGSSTVMTLVVTVNSGTAGQTITNTAIASSTVNDSNINDNTSSINTNVNNPTSGCTSNCGDGGGGSGGSSTSSAGSQQTSSRSSSGGAGGNGPIAGSFGIRNTGSGTTTSQGQSQVLGASTENSCYYLQDFLRKDLDNNPIEVKKLQIFLKYMEGFSNLDITGVYDNATIVAINTFQIKYKNDILVPWGYDGSKGTDYTYILTKKKVNEIFCKKTFPVTVLEQKEINTHRIFLESLKREAMINLQSQNEQNGQSSQINDKGQEILLDLKNNSAGTIGVENEKLGTLASLSSTTENISKKLMANVNSSGKKLVNILSAFVIWPLGRISESVTKCVPGYKFCGWLNLILILVIIIIAYFWYREHKNNKKIEEINKEIDVDLKR